jgi:hypothetical protein
MQLRSAPHVSFAERIRASRRNLEDWAESLACKLSHSVTPELLQLLNSFAIT